MGKIMHEWLLLRLALLLLLFGVLLAAAFVARTFATAAGILRRPRRDRSSGGHGGALDP